MCLIRRTPHFSAQADFPSFHLNKKKNELQKHEDMDRITKKELLLHSRAIGVYFALSNRYSLPWTYFLKIASFRFEFGPEISNSIKKSFETVILPGSPLFS